MPDRRDDRPPRSEERNTLEDDQDSAAVMMFLIATVSEVGQSRGTNEEGKGDAAAATVQKFLRDSTVFLSLFFFFFPSFFAFHRTLMKWGSERERADRQSDVIARCVSPRKVPQCSD